MAPPLSRTWYNTLIDDDGSGSVGTVWNKGQVGSFMDTIDASLAGLVDKSGTPAPGADLLPVFSDADTLRATAIKVDPALPSVLMHGTTVDGADNSFVALSGGGGFAASRGAYLVAFGNEHAQAGELRLVMGGVAGAVCRIYRGSDFAAVLSALATGVVDLPFGQLKFPATQNPSSEVNTLDDYREGTWTPILGGSGGTSGQTYSMQLGRFTKIGNLVIATFTLQLSLKGTITGNLQIQGLPFPSLSAGGLRDAAAIVWWQLATNWINVMAWASGGGTSVADLVGNQAATNLNISNLTTADLLNTTYLSGTLTYRTT